MNAQIEKTLKKMSLTPKQVVMCIPKGNPLLMHPLEIGKVYVLNKKHIYAICKEHNEIILVE